MHPISAILHRKMAKEISKRNPKSVIDIGGVGKLKTLLKCEVTDANKRKGHDGTNLKFPDKSFDMSVSVATLEHVDDQQKFLDESMRVAKFATVQWFPYGHAAAKVEEFKRKFSTYSHPCVVPTNLDERHMTPYGTISEHLLLLATIYPEINCEATYDFIEDYGNEYYGVIMAIDF